MINIAKHFLFLNLVFFTSLVSQAEIQILVSNNLSLSPSQKNKLEFSLAKIHSSEISYILNNDIKIVITDKFNVEGFTKNNIITLHIDSANEQNALEALLTHEIIHLHHIKNRSNEPAWIQEGLAQLGEKIVTGFWNQNIKLAFQFPNESYDRATHINNKTYNFELIHGARSGHAVLFFAYIYRLCGKTDFFNFMMNSSSHKTGKELINEYLIKYNSKKKYCSDHKNISQYFQQALKSPSYSSEEKYIIEGL